MEQKGEGENRCKIHSSGTLVLGEADGVASGILLYTSFEFQLHTGDLRMSDPGRDPAGRQKTGGTWDRTGSVDPAKDVENPCPWR